MILYNINLISLKFDLPNGIQLFCFPDAHYWSANNEESLEHFLVLTDPDGTRRFAYSRRILDMPLAYCILTSKQSKLYPMVNNFQCQCCQLCYLPFSMNKQILEELEKQHGISDESMQEMIRLLCAQTFPQSNKDPIFLSHSGKIVKSIKR